MKSSWTRVQTCVPCTGRRIPIHCVTKEEWRTIGLLRGHQQWEFSGQVLLTEPFCSLLSSAATAQGPFSASPYMPRRWLGCHTKGETAQVVVERFLGSVSLEAQSCLCSRWTVRPWVSHQGSIGLWNAVLKMDNFRVSCYIDSGVRRELMKPFIWAWVDSNSFLLIFILLIVSLKMCASSASIAKERQKQYDCLTQRIEREEIVRYCTENSDSLKIFWWGERALGHSFYFFL